MIRNNNKFSKKNNDTTNTKSNDSSSITSSNMNAFYLTGMFFIAIVFTLYIIYKYGILEDYNFKVNSLQAEIEYLEEQNEDLLRQTEYKSSDEHIEELAREKLGMLKNNEIIFYDTNK